MDLSEQQTLNWITFLLGLHDQGKFSETFQQLRPDLRKLFWPDTPVKKTNYSIRHDTMGQMLWRVCLKQHLFKGSSSYLQDFADDTLRYWLNPVFGYRT